MINGNGYNVPGLGGFLTSTCLSHVELADAKLTAIAKIGGEAFRVTDFLKGVLDLFKGESPEFAKQIVHKSKLAKSIIQLQRMQRACGLPEDSVCGLIECLRRPISGCGYTIQFDIERDFLTIRFIF
jgi:hypothetical protein